MGALVRGRQAERYRTIANIPEIDPGRLEAIITAYEEGSIAYDKDGEPIPDGQGDYRGGLEVALEALTPDELKALIAFNDSIIDGTNPVIKEMADDAESADDQPSGYDPSAAAHERLMSLLGDILGDLPGSPRE